MPSVVSSVFPLGYELQIQAHLLDHFLCPPPILITMICFTTEIGSPNIEGKGEPQIEAR